VSRGQYVRVARLQSCIGDTFVAFVDPQAIADAGRFDLRVEVGRDALVRSMGNLDEDAHRVLLHDEPVLPVRATPAEEDEGADQGSATTSPRHLDRLVACRTRRNDLGTMR
jgi:hypothetical protein